MSPIFLIGPDNEKIGEIETSRALQMASEQGMDLVEIVPDKRPPVCKIMDYGKFKYEESKKAQKNRAAAKSSEMKQVRLGRSVKIDKHDVQIRIDQSRRFILAGHKVHVVQRFRGREMAHREIGLNNLREVEKQLIDVAKIEQPPRWMGKEASIILAPDKVKVEALKRKLEKERAELAKAQGISEEALAKAEAARIAAEEAKIAAADKEDDDEGDDEA